MFAADFAKKKIKILRPDGARTLRLNFEYDLYITLLLERERKEGRDQKDSTSQNGQKVDLVEVKEALAAVKVVWAEEKVALVVVVEAVDEAGEEVVVVWLVVDLENASLTDTVEVKGRK